MGIRYLRAPSETPNILASDDCKMFRYGTGDWDGYIPNVSEEVASYAVGNKLTVHSGELVINGHQVILDASGIEYTFDTYLDKRYCMVILRLDLRATDSPVLSHYVSYSLTANPTFNPGEDLSRNVNGYRDILLYRCEVQNGVISNLVKVVEPVKYLKQRLQEFEDDLREGRKEVNKVNGLVFSEDSSTKILSVEDDSDTYTIRKYKLLWEGESSEVSISEFNLKSGDYLEVHCLGRVFELRVGEVVNFPDIEVITTTSSGIRYLFRKVSISATTSVVRTNSSPASRLGIEVDVNAVRPYSMGTASSPDITKIYKVIR